MEALIVLLGLVVLAVPVLLIAALVSIAGLKNRVGVLERDLAAMQRAPRTVQAADAQPARPAATSASPGAGDPTLGELMGTAVPRSPAPAPARASQPPSPAPSPQSASASVSAASPPPLPPPPPRQPVVPAGPNYVEIGLRAVKRWFTVGNVPVKIGMLVLLAGVAALLKYASDQGWLRMPIELRLAGVTVAALAALVFGWRQRSDKRAFALALQGGAIGVLLLTVFAAFKLYGLMPAGAAFGLSVVLVAGLGVLAVLQDSRTLAILGILAGFLAPIWLSTGSGNHVALFSYYALLNAAIFAIAWVRPWRILNLLGFVFTWGIGTAWGALQYSPDKFASTEPFLLLFFAFYLLIPILYARKQPASRGDRIDACLLFGTPLIAFALQAGLLDSYAADANRLTLAFYALGLAAIYVVLAKLLLPRERYRPLGQVHAVLAVGFATLAVPLALSARATASVFALEGAGMLWLGLRQQRHLPQWAGIGLQLAAACAFVVGAGVWYTDAQAIANPTFMGALLIAVAGFASAWSARDAGKLQLAAVFYAWALLWWCGNAVHEIGRFVAQDTRADVLLAFVALTGWLAAEVHRKRPAALLSMTTLAAFVLAAPIAFAQADAHVPHHPFAGSGAWAWLVFAALGVRSLVCLRGGGDKVAAWTQFAWWLLWPTVLSLLASYVAQRFGLAEGWELALLALPWLALVVASQLRWHWLAAPLGERFDAYRTPLQSTAFVVLGIGWVLSLLVAGDSAPLPWLPLLNPLELAQLAVLALLARWLWSSQALDIARRWRIPMLAIAGFLVLTWTTLRAVHHWGGVYWDPGLLSTSLAQTSLTVLWSVLGVAGWIIGSRRGQRTLWLAGAVLMAVVLAKLVLVDRGNLGNGLGIASFIAYGLLCTLVGYFAPAPPRARNGIETEAAA